MGVIVGGKDQSASGAEQVAASIEEQSLRLSQIETVIRKLNEVTNELSNKVK